ncbi:hypothetical protein BGZ70_001709 [Mortierella alpina]|uniref:Uncharacterized protein n=1 Tax=Mortierella alpina TaxID=64518 RepID=A0A9P6IVD0_MORAP|nr:hypothetical protein BGZ70_001709 [Mortierella alpina]
MSSDRLLPDITARAVPGMLVEFTATISTPGSATNNYLVAGLEINNALFVHSETGNLALIYKMWTPLDYEVQLNCRARFYGDDGTAVGSSTMDMNFDKTQTEQLYYDVISKEALQGVVKLKVELLLTCSVDLTPGA